MKGKYIQECEARRKTVERALAISLTAADAPTDAYMKALDDYIFGKMTLEDLEKRVNEMEFVEE